MGDNIGKPELDGLSPPVDVLFSQSYEAEERWKEKVERERLKRTLGITPLQRGVESPTAVHRASEHQIEEASTTSYEVGSALPDLARTDVGRLQIGGR